MSAPLPSVHLAAPPTAGTAAAHRHRASATASLWGYRRSSLDSEGSDQGLGLWDHSNVAHMRLNAAAAAAGGIPIALAAASAASGGMAVTAVTPMNPAGLVSPDGATPQPSRQQDPQQQRQPKQQQPAQPVLSDQEPNRASGTAAEPSPMEAEPNGVNTDSGSGGSGTMHSPGKAAAASPLGTSLQRPLPYSAAADSPKSPTVAHASTSSSSAVARGAASHGSGASGRGHDAPAVGRSPSRLMAPGTGSAWKENGGLALLNLHGHQQHLLQQHLQELGAKAKAGAVVEAEAEAEAALAAAQTFSLRRTAYNDWVDGIPLADARRGATNMGVGGVVASGLEGKAVVLKKQPPERGTALYFKPSNRKPLLGGDILHVL
ncbi:hypothetical protein VOLCADRAFT_88619 [Volvox carteri f. nagariensis]|uniref:Uncharacterized protein n=1 Tax=Volvox carteri f. nagariensis TaxID=3068 RepID=D8TPH4_VOLCA|nr:uncharacterized protein VOLCADRAFT_88619 [Volvox carteri f. nagariensis]EFJ50765.1 hypothetical protein VOLCADRAFT_88619 [Volvox carteri f. nagariensis]|eukprot:XP_002948358.1 hypothetical protein VOLCADRAFT_88619 [Volvox carteri f. nagariensis]